MGKKLLARQLLHFILSRKLKNLEVAALVPQREIDTAVGGTFEDIQSRLMTQALRKLNYSLCQLQTLIKIRARRRGHLWRKWLEILFNCVFENEQNKTAQDPKTR